MSLPDVPIALYSKLTGASAVTNLVSTRIYNRQVPSGVNPSFPYVIFYLGSGNSPNIVANQMLNDVWRVEVRSAVSGKDARDIASVIHTALHGQTLSITGYTNYWTMAERFQEFADNVDGKTIWRHVTDFRIKADKN